MSDKTRTNPDTSSKEKSAAQEAEQAAEDADMILRPRKGLAVKRPCFETLVDITAKKECGRFPRVGTQVEVLPAKNVLFGQFRGDGHQGLELAGRIIAEQPGQFSGLGLKPGP